MRQRLFRWDRTSSQRHQSSCGIGRETQVRLQGELALDEPREGLQVRLDGTLSELCRVRRTQPSRLADWRSTPRASISMSVWAGTLRAPAPAGTVTIGAAALRYGDLAAADGSDARGAHRAAQIALESLAATWQGARLLAEGAVPLRMIAPEPPPGDRAGSLAAWRSTWLASLPNEPTSATLVARLDGITPNVLAPFVEPSQLKEIAGTVAATVTAEADTFAIDRVRASVVLDEASLTMAGVPFTQSSPTRLRLENGTARIENLRWNAQGNEVIVSGGATVTGPNPTVDLAVDGAVDLRILGAFASGFASGGVARSDFTVKGPLASPEIVGSIGITAGEIRIDNPPLAASDFNGIISVAAGRMATVSLNGLVNGGSATLAGEVSVKDPSDPRGRASLTARNVMLEYPDGFRTESNADLTLTLAAAGSTLAGRIEVLNGTYREPIMFSRGLLAGLTESHVVTPGTESSFLTNLRLDVTVATSRRGWHRQQLRPPQPRGKPESHRDRRSTGSGRPYRGSAGWRDLPRRQHVPHSESDRRSHESAGHRAGPDLPRRNASRQRADRSRAAVHGRRSVRAGRPVAGDRCDQPAGRSAAVRRLDRPLRGRRTTRDGCSRPRYWALSGGRSGSTRCVSSREPGSAPTFSTIPRSSPAT